MDAMDANMWCHETWVKATDPKKIVDLFAKMLVNAGFTICGFIGNDDSDPDGSSAIWQLSESHLAISVYPEEGMAHCQLASCNLEMYVEFLRLIKPYQLGDRWCHNTWISKTRPKTLRKVLRPILVKSGLKMGGFISIKFEPVGYSATWKSAKNYLAIHTYPEKGRTSCQMASDNLEKYVKFIRLIRPHQTT